MLTNSPLSIAPVDDPTQVKTPQASPRSAPAAPAGPSALPIAPQAPNATPSTQPVGPTTQAPSLPGTSPTDADHGVGTGLQGQPVTPPPLSTTDPLAFAPSSSNLPSGFTLGDPGSANWGTAYYNGQRVIGMGAGGIETDNGIIPGTTADQFQQLENAENANFMSPMHQQFSLTQAGQQSTDPAMSALLQNPEYQNLVINNPNTPYTGLFGQMSPQLQQLFEQTPGYGRAYPEFQAAGINSPTPGVFPGGGQGPVNANGQPITYTPQAAQALQALSGAFQGGGASGNVSTAPTSIAATGGTTTAPYRPAPTGPASDVNGSQPSAPLQIAGSGTTGGTTGSAPPATGGTSSGLGYSLTPTDPNNALTGQTIAPSSNIDFLNNALKSEQTWETATDPQYQAALRDANRYNFSQGRGISGIGTNSIGDIETQRQGAIDEARQQFLTQALGQENANNYANIGIAQQQQGFQNQQQQEAFSNALQQLLAGSSGDPSQIALVLAQIYGNQAGGIGNAASQYANSQTQANNSAIQNQQFQQYLNAILNGYGGNSSPQLPGLGDLPGVQVTPGGGY